MKKDYTEIEGWCTKEITSLYDRAVQEAKEGDVFVELGCYKGKSTCYMIDKIKESGKKIEFYVIDNFSTLGNVEQEFKENLGQDRLDTITFINEDSAQANRHLPVDSVNFIFIDTVHTADHLVNEINSWQTKLKKDCLVSGHDYHHTDMKDAFDRLGIQLYNVILSSINYHEDTVWRHTSWWYIN
jgi:hypothetical protein